MLTNQYSIEKLMLVAIFILLPTIIAIAIWDAHTYPKSFLENTHVDEFSDLYYDAEGVWYEPISEVDIG